MRAVSKEAATFLKDWMMYEPKQTAIDDKVQELLAEKLQDDDWLGDSLVSCLDEFRAFYSDNDKGFDFCLLYTSDAADEAYDV